MNGLKKITRWNRIFLLLNFLLWVQLIWWYYCNPIIIIIQLISDMWYTVVFDIDIIHDRKYYFKNNTQKNILQSKYEVYIPIRKWRSASDNANQSAKLLQHGLHKRSNLLGALSIDWHRLVPWVGYIFGQAVYFASNLVWVHG